MQSACAGFKGVDQEHNLVQISIMPLYCYSQELKLRREIFSISDFILPSPDLHYKQRNIQNQFLSKLPSTRNTKKNSNIKDLSHYILPYARLSQQTKYHSAPVPLYIALRQKLTRNTVTFSISSSLYCLPPDTHNKHSNIQYQFLSILPSPDPHNKHSIIQYQFLSILPSPDPHNKHSIIQYQFLTILPSPNPHKNTVIFSISFSLYCPHKTLTKNTVTFSISSCLHCPPQTLIINTVIFSISSSPYSPPQTLTKTQYHSVSVQLYIALSTPSLPT